MKKVRADLWLVENGYFESREKAKRSIMAGIVFANTEIIHKASDLIRPDALIEIKGKVMPYVSRGGLKLEKAIKTWELNFSEATVLDIGASTGGFTDCSLQHGANHVIAIDVGTNQLAWKLRNDARVSVHEKTNFRFFTADKLDGKIPNYVVIDVSFISLSLIFEVLKHLLSEEASVIALIKPQFEAGRDLVGKKGIIKDPKIHKKVLESTIYKLQQFGFCLEELDYSPIVGGEGNIEFISLWKKGEQSKVIDIEDIVKQAHQHLKKGAQ
ncbi:MAG: TlyA family RNA methyltransferase [Culicoidibacterales bacterium]